MPSPSSNSKSNSEIKTLSNKPWILKLWHFFNTPEVQDKTDVLEAIEQAQEQSLIDADAAKMMKSVMEVADQTVQDIMIPKSQMVSLKLNSPLIDLLPIIIQSSHSRFPVFDPLEHREKEARGHIVGILHAKDILKFVAQPNFSTLVLTANLLRPASFIPESKHLDSLLKEFRLSRNHLALVIDEYGALSGLVTIEDVLEQIVGDIEDEFDLDKNETQSQLIKKITKVEPDMPYHHGEPPYFEVSATTPLEDIDECFGTTFSQLNNHTHSNIDTLAGLILMHTGEIPPIGTEIFIAPLSIKITSATTRRIEHTVIRLIPEINP